MHNDLYIVHRRKPFHFPQEMDAPVWSTCLRSLAFVRADQIAELAQDGDEFYAREQAYQFLLEIVCGLHSPILGETEVFGQFKAFTTAWLELQPQRAALIQRIFGDAKGIRAQHLENLGIQSYGSWVRKNIAQDRVHIVGGGQLAQEILPYLSKAEKDVTVHVRDTRKFDGPAMALEGKGFTHGALVVAAPISAQDIRAWLGDTVPKQIFDLRETADLDPIGLETETFRLSRIFSEIEETKNRLQPVIAKVRADIQACSEKFASQAIIRPLGWDDLCA
jgi:glutamyl-tRNA reductase